MNRGEVWLTNLNPTMGQEISKTRPVVIVNNDIVGILPLKIIVPITDWKERYSNRPWMVKLEVDNSNRLTKKSAADTFQVRSLSQNRLVKKLGK
jgi:mRNA interferase MazF